MTTILSFESISADYAAYLHARDLSPHSIRAYLSDLRQFADWLENRTDKPFDLALVTEQIVSNWRDALVATSKPATVNRKLASLSTFFAWAIEDNQVDRDPTRHVHGLIQQPAAPQSLSRPALACILNKAQQSGNPRDIALLELLSATGLRASEVAALRRDDLQLGERAGWLTVRADKGHKQRRVPINSRARHALRAYLQQDASCQDAPLFTTRQGDAMTPYTIWRTVKKYAAQAGVENVSPHTFRQTVATRLARDPEIDLITAASFLGHSRLDTMARYSQPGEVDLAEVAERLG